MGAGSADRGSKLHWTVARDIGVPWLLTIPMLALMAAGLSALGHFDLGGKESNL